MLNIDQVFTAESQSIFDFLTVEGQGCHIPAYQRPYSWDATNVTRLLEDATLGLENLVDDPAAVRFLGTIIGVKGDGLVGAPPPLDRELPNNVLTIIDGQQRLCTLVVLNILLHAYVRELMAATGAPNAPVAKAIFDEAHDFLHELSKTFEFQGRNAAEINRLYPRIIRAMDDCWSRHAATARYESPIARFIWAYIAHIYPTAQPAGPFVYRPVDANGVPLDGHEALAGVIEFLRSEIDALATDTHSTFDLPAVGTLRTDLKLVAELWRSDAPAGMDAYMLAGDDQDPEFVAVSQVLRLTALGRFVNYRMAATVVKADSEDYAFDMFEALNTTGQPLTAFETFKPKVVEAEQAAYPTSPSRASIAVVEGYLNRFRKADERQNATSTLLIPFALSETGSKLEKHLSQQRRYLRDQYRAEPNLAGKRRFVASLATTAAFVSSAWRPQGRNEQPQLLPDVNRRDDEAEFCFEALRDIRHEITLAPLVRFYAAYQGAAAGAPRDKAAADFFGAIKAVTAFSMLWRASKGGTANIDGAYRDLMLKGYGGIAPLCRRPQGADAAVPSLANLRTALVAMLAAEGIDRPRWVRNASQTAIYRTGQAITRFLLMAAAHDTVPDAAHPGRLEKAKKGTLTLMSREKWRDDTLITVEHVAPDATNSAGWPADVYDDQRTVHRLGNLTLMPQIENNVLANRPWAQKRFLYQMFGAMTQQEAQAAITAAGKVGFKPTETAKDLAAGSHYLPMCAAIKTFAGLWDEAFIEARSLHMAELAWDTIYPWLVPPVSAAKAKGGAK